MPKAIRIKQLLVILRGYFLAYITGVLLFLVIRLFTPCQDTLKECFLMVFMVPLFWLIAGPLLLVLVSCIGPLLIIIMSVEGKAAFWIYRTTASILACTFVYYLLRKALSSPEDKLASYIFAIGLLIAVIWGFIVGADLVPSFPVA